MKVQITEYSPAWRDSFEREKKLLEAAVGENTGVVEHIGSTSVIGLAAKPVIDIMIGLRDFSIAETLVPKIEALGYEYIPEYEDAMPDRRYFKKAITVSTHHVHMVKMGGEFWERHLLFRDFLRGNLKTADEYVALKKNLAKIDWKNKNDYTDAKTIFIKNIESEARKQNRDSEK